MKGNQNNDENEINQVCTQIINNLMPQLQYYQEKTLQKINQDLTQYGILINNQINNYEKEIKNILINDNDDVLRKKKINLDELKIPNLINLENLNNTNYLINVILLCLSNIKTLAKYFLTANHEEQILFKNKDDPSGIDLSSSFLKLLDHIWKGTKKVYNPCEIHQKLKTLMNNNYYLLNPGLIINFIVQKLHEELNYKNNVSINPPSWNYNPQDALNNYFNYFQAYQTGISVRFFSPILITKKTQQNTPIYLYTSTVVFDLYLDNIGDNPVSLENQFQNLYIDMNDRAKYCSENEYFDGKKIMGFPKIVILNILRNNKKFLNYPNILYDYYSAQQNGQNPEKCELYAVVISKCVNNYKIFYAFIKNAIDHKWYLYNNQGIRPINNYNEIFDMENVSLLIYQK